MATSGSYNYSVTAADIIEAALEDIGVLIGGQSVSGPDSVTSLRTLNFIVKQWQGTADMAKGLKVWTRQRVTMFLAKGQQRYLIGPASTDARATTQYGRTTLSADEAAGQTSLSITSNTDATTYPGTTVTMTSGDHIGIELDDGTLQWTTITGTPTTTANVVDALTSAASSGNTVYWFTTRAQRFPVMEYAYLREPDATDSVLHVYRDVQEYEALTDKHADGDPIALLVEPQRLTTAITLDSQPDDVTKVVNMTVLYPAEDYDATTDDIAYPQEFFAALEWELAFRLAPKFEKPWTQEMQLNYTQATAIGRQLNPENTSQYFQPGRE
jgi:hypothetical protein